MGLPNIIRRIGEIVRRRKSSQLVRKPKSTQEILEKTVLRRGTPEIPDYLESEEFKQKTLTEKINSLKIALNRIANYIQRTESTIPGESFDIIKKSYSFLHGKEPKDVNEQLSIGKIRSMIDKLDEMKKRITEQKPTLYDTLLEWEAVKNNLMKNKRNTFEIEQTIYTFSKKYKHLFSKKIRYSQEDILEKMLENLEDSQIEKCIEIFNEMEKFEIFKEMEKFNKKIKEFRSETQRNADTLQTFLNNKLKKNKI